MANNRKILKRMVNREQLDFPYLENLTNKNLDMTDIYLFERVFKEPTKTEPLRNEIKILKKIKNRTKKIITDIKQLEKYKIIQEYISLSLKDSRESSIKKSRESSSSRSEDSQTEITRNDSLSSLSQGSGLKEVRRQNSEQKINQQLNNLAANKKIKRYLKLQSELNKYNKELTKELTKPDNNLRKMLKEMLKIHRGSYENYYNVRFKSQSLNQNGEITLDDFAINLLLSSYKKNEKAFLEKITELNKDKIVDFTSLVKILNKAQVFGFSSSKLTNKIIEITNSYAHLITEEHSQHLKAIQKLENDISTLGLIDRNKDAALHLNEKIQRNNGRVKELSDLSQDIYNIIDNNPESDSNSKIKNTVNRLQKLAKSIALKIRKIVKVFGVPKANKSIDVLNYQTRQLNTISKSIGLAQLNTESLTQHLMRFANNTNSIEKFDPKVEVIYTRFILSKENLSKSGPEQLISLVMNKRKDLFNNLEANLKYFEQTAKLAVNKIQKGEALQSEIDNLRQVTAIQEGYKHALETLINQLKESGMKYKASYEGLQNHESSQRINETLTLLMKDYEGIKSTSAICNKDLKIIQETHKSLKPNLKGNN
ncbi:MAG: hypothetical protein JWM09_1233 [Francisellaceae bacterium]|nr:hypothetical protein [Francisellaceae bacterium]